MVCITGNFHGRSFLFATLSVRMTATLLGEAIVSPPNGRWLVEQEERQPQILRCAQNDSVLLALGVYRLYGNYEVVHGPALPDA